MWPERGASLGALKTNERRGEELRFSDHLPGPSDEQTSYRRLLTAVRHGERGIFRERKETQGKTLVCGAIGLVGRRAVLNSHHLSPTSPFIALISGWIPGIPYKSPNCFILYTLWSPDKVTVAVERVLHRRLLASFFLFFSFFFFPFLFCSLSRPYRQDGYEFCNV